MTSWPTFFLFTGFGFALYLFAIYWDHKHGNHKRR